MTMLRTSIHVFSSLASVSSNAKIHKCTKAELNIQRMLRTIASGCPSSVELAKLRLQGLTLMRMTVCLVWLRTCPSKRVTKTNQSQTLLKNSNKSVLTIKSDSKLVMKKFTWSSKSSMKNFRAKSRSKSARSRGTSLLTRFRLANLKNCKAKWKFWR